MGIKTVTLPLVILGCLTILAISGLGTVVTGQTGYSNLGEASSSAVGGCFDVTGRQITYANLTVLSGLETGVFEFDYEGVLDGGSGVPHGFWTNASGMFYLDYVDGVDSAGGFTMSGGLITVVGVLVVVVGMAVLTSFHILSSGLTDTGVSAVVKGSFFAFVFGVVALSGGALLCEVPVVGSLIYLGLSLVYLVGVVDMFGHPSGA